MTTENRPKNCRNRLRDEGQIYPKSGCVVCKTGGLTGCPHEHKDYPAGPISRFETLDEYDARTKADTLTPLDHFAMAALPAIVSADPEELPGKSWEPRYERIAAEAYAVARAMMAERAK